MAERPANTYTAFVDPLYTESERKRLGIQIIDYIVKRTKDGKGVGNKPFKSKYSTSYVKSPEFEIAGKTPKDVNLTLSGDMLDSVEIIDASVVGRILIGFRQDNESDKSVFLEEKGYTFLGLSNDELQDLITKFGEPNNSIGPADISTSLVESFVRGIFGR